MMQRHFLLGGGIGLVALVSIGSVAVYMAAQRAEPPKPLGLQNGQLAACPATPNCVSSTSTTAQHAMTPLHYNGDTAAAKAQLLAILRTYPRVTMLEDGSEYVHAVFRSAMMGFPDDVEFYFDATAKLIQFRSAARMGRSDVGVNRARMEGLRGKLAAVLEP